MNVNVYKTNQQLLASVAPGQSNTTASSLILFGKNYSNYGVALNENIVHLMESFANSSPPPNPIAGQVWYNTITHELQIYDPNNGGWSLVNASSIRSIAESLVKNRIYVSQSGNDSLSGLSWFNSKRTLQSALQVAEQQIALGNFTAGSTVILVASGDYTENCPLTIPEGVSLVGDDLRSVTVRPSVATSNVFYLNSGCYVYGITVKGHQLSPSAIDITPTGYANSTGQNLPRSTTQSGWAFSFEPGTTITSSPYVQNCSSISGDSNTPGGGGIWVDSASINQNSTLHSMVVDAFTQINQGGIGAKIQNKGFAQLVGFYTNFCQFGILAVDGGHASVQNSNCSFGNYALWSEGSRYLDNLPTTVNSVTYPGAINTLLQGSWTTQPTQTVFVASTNTKVYADQLPDFVVYVDGVLQTQGIDYFVSDAGSVTTLTDSATTSQINFYASSAPVTGSVITAYIMFGSLIEANAISMTYAGAGINAQLNLSPGQGGHGHTDTNKYTIRLSYGRIYQTAMDQDGNWYVGGITPGAVSATTGQQGKAMPAFRINQRTGMVDGSTFYRSVFGFMTPFVLALTRRG